MPGVKKRIFRFLDYKSITAKDFSKRTGLYNRHFVKGGSISTQTAKTIVKHFPELSITWLITGLGEMLHAKEVNEDELDKFKIELPSSEIHMLNSPVTSQQMAKQRIGKFISYRGLSNIQFAKDCNLEVTFLRSRKNITNNILTSVFEAFPELSMEWLITGNGEMIADPIEQIKILNQKRADTLGLPVLNPDQDLANTILLDVKAAASGFKIGFRQSLNYQTVETLSVPHLRNKEGSYYAVPIEGVSMEPTIKSGDLLVGQVRLVYDLISGEPAVFYHHQEGLLCKRLFWHNVEKQTILLKSDNPEVEDIITPMRKLSNYIIQAECFVPNDGSLTKTPTRRMYEDRLKNALGSNTKEALN